jgi:hypothetical protein
MAKAIAAWRLSFNIPFSVLPVAASVKPDSLTYTPIRQDLFPIFLLLIYGASLAPRLSWLRFSWRMQ